MKTRTPQFCRTSDGYALLMVLTIIAASLLIAGATIYRTYTVSKLNDRNNQYVKSLTAAEAAAEKVYARLAYDFQSAGLGAVTNNLAIYRTNIPTAAEDPYWSSSPFQFSDGQGNMNRTYVNYAYSYSGPLPSQYPGLFTINSPVYRIVSNAKMVNGNAVMTNAVQEDILLALVPITQYAVFYQGLLEFSTCATMFVNGRVHCNSNVYVGSSSPLTFSSTVTSVGTISSPANNGQGPWAFPGNVTFGGNPGYKTNVPSVTLTINMTNTHSMVDMPPGGESPTSAQGQGRMYNQAQVVILISNTTVYARVQQSIAGLVPGNDGSPNVLTSPIGSISNAFPFLSLTNVFYDARENKTNITTQIDLGKYATWLGTNSAVTNKFTSGSFTYPTILYIADNRTTSANQQTAIRITNGIAPPRNGGLGFTMATQNPLYVWGNYNQTNSALLGTTNTTSGTVPSALMSDALTILSKNWNDRNSMTNGYDNAKSVYDATLTNTVNAAILTGVVPSTSSGSAGFSGGVHNLPRLLEDWNGCDLWLNTSIINLYVSTKATGQFQAPGVTYRPPTRHFSFDLNFNDPAKQPPGVPCAMVPIRFNWAVPPPNTVTYNVVP